MNDNEDIKALAEAIRRLMVVADTLERRANDAAQSQQQTSQEMQKTLVALRHEVDQLMQGVEQRAEQTMQQATENALNQALASFQQAVSGVTAKLAQAGQSMGAIVDAAINRIRQASKASWIAIISAIVVLIGGGGLLLWYLKETYESAQTRIDTTQVRADLMEAYSKVGITSCGGQPCIKLDLKSPRWGEHGEYILLDNTIKPQK